MFKCTLCGVRLGTRKQARLHAREKHRLKGKRLAPPTADMKFAKPSEISDSYVRV